MLILAKDATFLPKYHVSGDAVLGSKLYATYLMVSR